MSYKLQKLTQLLKTHEWSDCVFIIDNEKVPAHKLILAYTSPVFEMMFYGNLASSEVEITDIDAKDFKVMLEYVYTNRIKLESIPQAWNLIYIGQKYFLNDMIDQCVNYISNNLNIKHLLMSYEYSQMYGLDKLAEICFSDILMNAREIFNINSYHVKIDTLWDVLNKKVYTNMDDECLMLYILRWVEEECQSKQLDVNTENICNIASNYGILKYIQYCSTNEKVKSLKDESSKVLHKRHNCQLRQRYKISKKQVFNRPLTLTTLFDVDRKCFISGLSISTLHRPSNAKDNKYIGGINVKVIDVDNNHMITETEKRKEHFEYDDNVTLYFNDVFIVTPKVFYQISVTYYLENNSECELLLNYYSSTLNGNNNTNFEFIDEFDGSILNGIASYPI